MNQLRIPNEIGATVFALLAGLSALFFAAWILSPKTDDSAGQILAVAAPSAELEAAEEKISALEQQNEEVKSALSRETAMSKQIQEDLGARELQITEANRALELAKADSANLKKEIETLKGEFSEKSKMAATAEDTKSKLAESAKTIASLKKDLDAAKQNCEKEKEALQAQVKNLRRDLDKALYGEELKPAGEFPPLDLPYLINDPLQLSAPVRPLFARLRSFDGQPENLDKLYEDLKKNGNQSALHQVPFTVGSSDVTAEEMEALRPKLKDASKNSRLLVVGYASTDGDAKGNFELSSKRASSVAEAVASAFPGSKDSIQAVYFGQTNRFDSTNMAPNRIVEIWEVK